LIKYSTKYHFYFQQFSTESIQKLVSGAETLVLGDVLMKSPKHNKNIINELKMSAASSSSGRAGNSKTTAKGGNLKIKKVQVRYYAIS
jgi:hypothetical protein